jgi:hypothetical protein
MARTRKHTRSRHFAARTTAQRGERRFVVHTAHHGQQLADKDAAVRYASGRLVAAMTPGMVKRGVKVKTTLVHVMPQV